MREYVIEVVVRDDREEGVEGAERVITCTSIRATGELDARRQVLERLWHRRLLASQFNSIQVRQPKSR
jgi:hypothetical protein